MTEDADTALAEKRVHDARGETTRVAVGCDLGVATVDVSDDQVGRFGLAHRLEVRGVAGHGRLAVATDEDVHVGDAERVTATGFGPAVAVGDDGAALVAADAAGRVARAVPGHDPAATVWTDLGRVEPPVRAVEGDLVAAADGVYRAGEGLRSLGLDGAADVAAAGSLAATADGVFRHDGDWHRELSGAATLVAGDEDRAHAVLDGVLRARRDGEWVDADCPADAVAAVAYGPATYAATAEGTFLVDPATAKDGATGWRSRALGLGGVVGLAVL